MNANEIESAVNKLLSVLKTSTREEIDKMEEFDVFKNKNKIFYDLILAGDHDPVIFKQMMSMKRKLESGSTQYEVDVKFGKFMAEKYIDPVIKK